VPLLVLFLGLVVPDGRLHPTAPWQRLARLVGPATGSLSEGRWREWGCESDGRLVKGARAQERRA